MSKTITLLRSIDVEEFRGLKNIKIDFVRRLTLICGKNDTSKSTILGVIAQAFSFRKNYSVSSVDDLSRYRTLTAEPFESIFSEHFRLSEKYDKPGSMKISIAVYDGAEQVEPNLGLGLYASKDRPKPRPIVRGNTKTNGANSSRDVSPDLSSTAI